MAIQVRRGSYADLDTSKLLAGEPFVTLDQADGDYYVGMAISPTTTVRLATWNNLVNIRDECERFASESETNAESAETSAENAKVSEENASDYCEKSESAWNKIDDAMQRISPIMQIDFNTGMLTYTGSFFDFILDANGHLNWGIAI